MKKRLLSFFIIICAFIPALPLSLAGEAEAAAKIVITDAQFQEDRCDFQANLSGIELEGAVFTLVYSQSGQMRRIERRDAAETVSFSLNGLAATDRINVIWLDDGNMPLAQAEVSFAGALFSMIENYPPPDTIAQSGENLSETEKEQLKYALARLLVSSPEELPDLSGYHVAQMVSDGKGHSILQFQNAEDAERCAQRLGEIIKEGEGYVEPDSVVYLPPEDGGADVEDASSESPLSKSVSLIRADAYAADLLARGINHDVIVAVVDSGVDYKHEFLENRTVSGHDYVDNDDDPMDERYHGTHVAGTIVDCTPGLTNIKIMPVRVLNASGRGYSSVVALGIRYAADHGANVINLSLGGDHSACKDEAVAYAIQEKKATVVVAAGNTDIDANYYCPAHLKDAITVAAVDFDLKPADFSNYGSVVDIAAPGVDINSCVPKKKSASGYFLSSGTSMAAPHVSACAAMLLDEFGALAPSEVEQKLTQAAQTPPDWNQTAKKYGAGVADMEPFVKQQPEKGFYAILYGDNGELVFQNSATPEAGRATADEPYFVSAVPGDGADHALWHAHRADIKTVTFADEIQPLTTAAWFSGCENLTTIRNLKNLDTSKVTDMSQMFAGCKALTSLDLSELNTNNVTNMRQMFFECSKLETLDLSEWNTGKVSNMEDMFNGCAALKRIYASTSFNVSQVTDGAHMFQDCVSLEGALGTAYSSSHMNQSYARRDTLSSAGYFSSSRFYALLYADGEFVFQDGKESYTQKTPEKTYQIGCAAEQVDQKTRWYDERGQIKMVTFADEIQPLTTATWFLNCDNLTTVKNVANLNALRVTDMSQTFAGCKALTSLDLSALNTNNVTNMRQMFFECSALKKLDLSGWNTSNVSSMEDMFNGCKALEEIWASNKFLVVNVEDGGHMFQDCESLAGGNGTKYDPAHTDKSYAQRDAAPVTPGYFCPGVSIPPVSETLYAVLYSDGELAFQTSLDARSGKTILKTYETDSEGYAKGNARGSYMAWYNDRASITSVNFVAAIYPASTAQWFYSCENLASVENPANLHTDYVTDMSQMFGYCKSLTTLDLRGFNTVKTTDMSEMFYRCENLERIYTSISFVLGATTDTNLMFGECVALQGEKGTSYDPNHKDGAYARIDGGESAPGYFSS